RHGVLARWEVADGGALVGLVGPVGVVVLGRPLVRGEGALPELREELPCDLVGPGRAGTCGRCLFPGRRRRAVPPPRCRTSVGSALASGAPPLSRNRWPLDGEPYGRLAGTRGDRASRGRRGQGAAVAGQSQGHQRFHRTLAEAGAAAAGA